MAAILLTRDQFREAIFARDGDRCVICRAPGQDAHHIVERRLWPDGGYYLENGATLCGPCHIEAESTRLSCDRIRRAAGIDRIVLPPHLYRDQEYDKWGNPVLPDGRRLRGELMTDGSVLRIIDPGIEFSHYVKYPRTYHLPWSPGMNDDDRMMTDLSGFDGQRVTIMEKMDGENTSMYRDHIHARSIDSGGHPSRDRARAIWGRIRADIPEGWRLNAENMYAVHSITYDDLPGYLLLFSIWDGLRCLPWDETAEWAQLLELPTPRIIYDGMWDEGLVRKIGPLMDPARQEGYVVRVSRSFGYHEFRSVVGKYVREHHIHTHGHWMRQRMAVNGLRAGDVTLT
jgi:hypothetical protein